MPVACACVSVVHVVSPSVKGSLFNKARSGKRGSQAHYCSLMMRHTPDNRCISLCPDEVSCGLNGVILITGTTLPLSVGGELIVVRGDARRFLSFLFVGRFITGSVLLIKLYLLHFYLELSEQFRMSQCNHSFSIC